MPGLAATTTDLSTQSVDNTVVTENKTSFITSGTTIGTTETTIVIPAGTRAFDIYARDPQNAILTFSDQSGGTASQLTSNIIKMGNIWKVDNLTGDAPITIYILSNKTNTVVQLLRWT